VSNICDIDLRFLIFRKCRFGKNTKLAARRCPLPVPFEIYKHNPSVPVLGLAIKYIVRLNPDLTAFVLLT
jgi:hypothetical protein